jgi:hypothetical protein
MQTNIYAYDLIVMAFSLSACDSDTGDNAANNGGGNSSTDKLTSQPDQNGRLAH